MDAEDMKTDILQIFIYLLEKSPIPQKAPVPQFENCLLLQTSK